MAQNIYDDPAFFAGYSRLPRSLHGLAGAPEWPMIRALLPPALGGKRVIDLGCGFGWFARWARAHGARSVLGLDLSDNMIARAKAETDKAETAKSESDDGAIDYRIADLETLELPQAAFDLAYSSLAFHYVADFARLMAVVHRALVPGGELVFSIEHPIYMAAQKPDWIADSEGRRSWPVNGYAAEGQRRTNWLADGVIKYHRTLATTVNTLIDGGFTIRRLCEFAPTAEQIAANPALAEETDRPMMLIVSAQR